MLMLKSKPLYISVEIGIFMTETHWRHKLPDDLNVRINTLVRKTNEFKDAYEESPHVRTSQMWVCLGEGYKEIQLMQERIISLEASMNAQKSRLRKAGETIAQI